MLAAIGTDTRRVISDCATWLSPCGHYSDDLAVQQADRALYAAKERGPDGWAFYDASGAAHVEPAPDVFRMTAS